MITACDAIDDISNDACTIATYGKYLETPTAKEVLRVHQRVAEAQERHHTKVAEAEAQIQQQDRVGRQILMTLLERACQPMTSIVDAAFHDAQPDPDLSEDTANDI
jgi:guanylate kinase